MTVSTLLNRTSFVANSVTTNFAFNNYLQAASDLVVLLVDSSGNQTVQILGSAYTVSGTQDANGFFPGGATIIFAVAPATGMTVVMYRDPPTTQLTSYVDNDALPASSLSGPMDKLTTLEQRSRDLVGRSLRQPDGDTADLTTLPAKVTRASMYLAFDASGNPIASPGTTAVATPISAYMTTELDDVDAATAITTRIAGVPNLTADATPDAINDLLTTYDTSATTAKKVRPIDIFGAAAGFVLLNGDLVATVGSSALTVAIKTTAGNDPSAADPVYVVFRNATLTSGTKAVLKITAATSFVVSSGSTLGTVNSTPFRAWVVGFNDAGTFRLGVVQNVSGTDIFPLRDGIQSSTAEGGAGAADSAQTIYTGTAVASKAMRLLGYMDWQSGLATAGTWSAGPDAIQHYSHGLALPGTEVQSVISETGAVATGTTILPFDDTIPQSGEGDQYLSKAITPTAKMNVLQLSARLHLANDTSGSSNVLAAALFQDATANALAVGWTYTIASSDANQVSVEHHMQAGTTSSTTLKARAGCNLAGTTTFNGVAAARKFGGALASYLRVTELMA